MPQLIMKWRNEIMYVEDSGLSKSFELPSDQRVRILHDISGSDRMHGQTMCERAL